MLNFAIGSFPLGKNKGEPTNPTRVRDQSRGRYVAALPVELQPVSRLAGLEPATRPLTVEVTLCFAPDTCEVVRSRDQTRLRSIFNPNEVTAGFAPGAISMQPQRASDLIPADVELWTPE